MRHMWYLAFMCSYKSNVLISIYVFFFFNDTATTEIYTLSLHDALPIWRGGEEEAEERRRRGEEQKRKSTTSTSAPHPANRSEEHTSELQSRLHLVCRLLLEKKKNIQLQRVCSQQSTVYHDFAARPTRAT